MPIIRVHVLIPGNILYLVNLYLHALYFRLSYLMTYTYTFLYLYVLLLLYQTILSSVRVQNINFFFNTLRYPKCPNYLPLYLFFYTPLHIKSMSITISCSYLSIFLSCIPIDFTHAICTLNFHMWIQNAIKYHILRFYTQ